MRDALNFVNEEFAGTVPLNSLDTNSIITFTKSLKGMVEAKGVEDQEAAPIISAFVKKLFASGFIDKNKLPDNIVVSVNKDNVLFNCKREDGVVKVFEMPRSAQAAPQAQPLQIKNYNNAPTNTFERYGNIQQKAGQ